jgi:hypothetical protein
MKPGIPKFRKESHPERARNKIGPTFSRLLRHYKGTKGAMTSLEVLIDKI